ncbi:hypothetical protein AMECASPLE_025163 [Ameca splendens]|uniref:Uncharacterized protein n=1 Tax=Ameca splendens TaxID=208324 RepID=A0ABV0ZQT5_9TELE
MTNKANKAFENSLSNRIITCECHLNDLTVFQHLFLSNIALRDEKTLSLLTEFHARSFLTSLRNSLILEVIRPEERAALEICMSYRKKDKRTQVEREKNDVFGQSYYAAHIISA